MSHKGHISVTLFSRKTNRDVSRRYNFQQNKNSDQRY
jgi:hypothetical protein